MPAFDSNLEKFAALNAQVLDISTDSIYSHIAWQKHDIGTMHFPMCSDFYPHAAVTQAFDVSARRAATARDQRAIGVHRGQERENRFCQDCIRWTRRRRSENCWRHWNVCD